MAGLAYLTVQDVLWIHHRVTGRPGPFDYAKLEEATYLQYGYGNSSDLVGQASRFLKGFAKKSPFSEGNEAVGFVGFVAFLRANGADLEQGDAEAAASSPDAIVGHIVLGHDGSHDGREIRDYIASVLADFPQTIAKGAGGPVPV